MRKIVFESSLRVPKCMRRYERKGYLQSTGRWLGQWIRLLMRKQMTLMEADYFDFKSKVKESQDVRIEGA